jgi:hypothetical protein
MVERKAASNEPTAAQAACTAPAIPCLPSCPPHSAPSHTHYIHAHTHTRPPPHTHPLTDPPTHSQSPSAQC